MVAVVTVVAAVEAMEDVQVVKERFSAKSVRNMAMTPQSAIIATPILVPAMDEISPINGQDLHRNSSSGLVRISSISFRHFGPLLGLLLLGKDLVNTMVLLHLRLHR